MLVRAHDCPSNYFLGTWLGELTLIVLKGDCLCLEHGSPCGRTQSPVSVTCACGTACRIPCLSPLYLCYPVNSSDPYSAAFSMWGSDQTDCPVPETFLPNSQHLSPSISDNTDIYKNPVTCPISVLQRTFADLPYHIIPQRLGDDTS